MSDFWERRKAAVRAEGAAEEKAKVAADEAEEKARLGRKPDEEILQELDLPDPDSMVEGDDFSVFLKRAVPDRIRLRALRRLWTTNPVLANLDGLVDYGEDFTDAATVIENLQTAYRVGEGMARHVMATDEQAVAATDEAETATSESPTEDPCDTESDGIPDNLSRNRIEPKAEKSEQDSQVCAENGETNGLKPRRMSYHFDESPATE